MNTIEYVRALVCQDAAGVLRIEPPVGEAIRVRTGPRRRPLPLLPIKRPAEPVYLAIAEIIVQPPGTRHADGAELSRSHQPAAFQVQIVAAALHSDLDDVLRLLFGLDQFYALFRSLT